MGVKDDEFDVDAELQKPAITKAGDVWTLGRHRLVCGDSTKPETFSLLMDGLKANLGHHRPALQCQLRGGAGKIQNDNMENAAFYFLLAAFQNTEKPWRTMPPSMCSMRTPRAELPKGVLRRRLLPLRDVHLEEAVPGAGPFALPVAA